MEPSLSTVKRLFAASSNRCAFGGCSAPIVEDSGTVTGTICHIKARSPGGPRYDSKQSEQNRHSFTNLVLMCARHSKLIDSEPERFTAELLTEMKEAHERSGSIHLPPGEGQNAQRLLEGYRLLYSISTTGHVMIGSPGAIQADEVVIKTENKTLKLAAEPRAGEQFLKQRSDAVVQFEAVNPFKDKGYTGYREACFFPEQFERNRFTIEQLGVAAEHAHVTSKGWPFLFIDRYGPKVTYAIADGLETLIQPPFGGNDRCDFWRFQQSGFFYQRTLMWEESWRDRDGAGLHAADIDAIATYAGEAVYCLARVYNGLLEDDESLTFVIRICGTQGRELKTFNPHEAWPEQCICRIPEIEVQRKHSMTDWREDGVDHAVNMAKDVFLRFNWQSPNLQEIQKTIEGLFARRL